MSQKNEKNSCLKCFNLILTALPSIVFGVFTIVFTLSQNNVAKKIREQDQRQVDEQNLRTTFENFIKEISSLLLDEKFNRTNVEHLLHIRVKTLTTLRYLDGIRRRDVVLFLYESGLLQKTTDGKAFLHLENANLTDVEFIGTSTMKIGLDRLNLAGVYAPNIVFSRCSLNFASFDRATLINAKFLSSIISNTSFYRIVATHVTMNDLMFFGNDFRDSKIQGIRLTSVSTMGTIDLTNADVYDNSTKVDSETIQLMLSSSLVILTNARLPDGTFGPINDSNQIENGDAENIGDWFSTDESMLMERVPIENLSNLIDRNQFGRFSFVARKLGKSTIEQDVNVSSFSVLIDAADAAFRLTTIIGCFGSNENNISVSIDFFRENRFWISGHENQLETIDRQQMKIFIEKIPPETFFITLRIQSNIFDSNGFCFVDNLKLKIFQNK